MSIVLFAKVHQYVAESFNLFRLFNLLRESRYILRLHRRSVVKNRHSHREILNSDEIFAIRLSCFTAFHAHAKCPVIINFPILDRENFSVIGTYEKVVGIRWR